VTGPGISAAGLTYMYGTKCELATEGSPAFEALRGKVVFGGIWGNENLECQPVFDPFFDLLRKAGALGYVGFDPYSPPGADCFDHYNIDPNKCKFCDGKVVAVTITDTHTADKLGAVAIELARLGPSGVLVQIEVQATGDNRFETVYRSWYWLVVLRIVMPAFALYTSCTALLELVCPQPLAASSAASGAAIRKWSVATILWVCEFPVGLLIAHCRVSRPGARRAASAKQANSRRCKSPLLRVKRVYIFSRSPFFEV